MTAPPPEADVARLILAPEAPDPVDPGNLGNVPGVAQVHDLGAQQTTTVHYDTPDLRLTREGASLVRRGDEDTGKWSLRLPGLRRSRPSPTPGPTVSDGAIADDEVGPGGEVVQPAAPGEAQPPDRLARLARAFVRGAPLIPVATVRMTRHTHRLVGPGGEVVVELLDDQCEARGPAGEPQRRRLLTVSGPDDPGVRKALGERLGQLGAAPAAAPDDLGAALGPYASAGPDVAPPPPSLSRDDPAAELVAAGLRSHVRALLEWEAPVQLDHHDAVHKMRVAVRRLRSSLRTFGPLLDPATIERLEPELRWLAASLGGPRDAEVIRERLLGIAAELPPELRRADFERSLAETLDERHRAARRTLLADLDSPRYRQLLVDVVGLAARPPVLPEARRPIAKVVPGLLRRAWRKLDRRVTRAHESQGVEADLALHDARKAAKQLRYAAEACVIGYGRDAQRLAARAEAVQEVLGEHQDSIVAQELLVELAREAAGRGEDTFGYGLLVGEERARADRSRSAFEPAWEETSRKRHRHWLSR